MNAKSGFASRLLIVCVIGITLAVYLITLPPSVLPGDSGELIAASHTLSIAHPPGYPLYLMLGKLFSSALAVASLAYRYNLLSAVLASVTAAVLFLMMRGLGINQLLAFAVTIAVATLGSFWLQATNAEVYMLNALFTVLLLAIPVLGKRYGQRTYLLLGLVGGLSLSHHLSLVYPLVAALVILVFERSIVPRPKTLAVALLMLLIGLTVWLYIPVRSSLGPPLTWERTDSVSGFLSHITAQGYRWRVRPPDLVPRLLDVLRFFRLLLSQAGTPLVLLALVGVAANLRRPTLIGGFMLLVLFYACHYAIYNIPDIEGHILPATIGVAVLAGLGLGRLARFRKFWRPAQWLIAGLVFLIIVINIAAIEKRRDQWFAADYAEAIVESARQACGDSCLIVTSGDISSFPLLYRVLVESETVRMFDLGASNPEIIGAKRRPRTMDGCVEMAARRFGLDHIVLLGHVPRLASGRPTRMCGMVYTIDGSKSQCRSPIDYHIRGVGSDLREYSSRLLSGEYNLHLARWLLSEGDTAGAVAYTRRALDQAVDDLIVHGYAAKLYLRMGMVDDGFETARRMVGIDADYFEGHDLTAKFLSMTGRTSEAIAEYEKALRSNPYPAPVHSNLGNLYRTAGDYGNALKHFRAAVDLDSTVVNAFVGIGLTFESRGEPGQALPYYRRARRIDPGSIPAYHSEASLLLSTERLDDAIALLREGLVRVPASALLLSDLGLCFLRQTSIDSTIFYLEKALEIDPSLLAARGNLAVAYESKGLKSKAAEHYTRYLEIAPPGRLRDQAREALRALAKP